MGRDVIGTFESWVLMAVLRLGTDAYGRRIHEELETRLARQIAIGQVYVTLERMQEKGFVSSSFGGATPVRGGRVKRYFKITGVGELALRESLKAVDQLRPDTAWGLA